MLMTDFSVNSHFVLVYNTDLIIGDIPEAVLFLIDRALDKKEYLVIRRDNFCIKHEFTKYGFNEK